MNNENVKKGAEPQAEPEKEIINENEPVEIVGISFRQASKIYYFAPNGTKLNVGDFAIVETARGLEFGKVLVPNKILKMSEVVSPLKNVIRKATDDDKERYEKNKQLEVDAMKICKEKIAHFKLEMNLVDVEYTFDNSKLLFYFTADGRVDFRELVKNLASVFKTRIELRQIGIRDEAKIMGGLGSCGRPFCCSEFLSDFAQVSIKMAKEQNFSLNSAKISGSCGRLMCCLRYEHETYEEALKTTPHVNSTVSTPAGNGTIIETRPLLQLVKVRLDEKPENPRLFACEEVKVIKGAKNNNNGQNNEKSDEISE
ncbi:MAG: stage 0 sporulation family protein [Clostridia bacterium]|nr:stage 0 sporulation family protein [Clostridia bacterium]MBQ5634283.1 stage 0 sporulation family protein [Clostridia bacterium]MBQ5800836.1 stage 0 sporulation family protein [Clostridia bacterium]